MSPGYHTCEVDRSMHNTRTLPTSTKEARLVHITHTMKKITVNVSVVKARWRWREKSDVVADVVLLSMFPKPSPMCISALQVCAYVVKGKGKGKGEQHNATAYRIPFTYLTIRSLFSMKSIEIQLKSS